MLSDALDRIKKNTKYAISFESRMTKNLNDAFNKQMETLMHEVSCV